MATPASNPKEPGKFKKTLNSNSMDESIAARLPRGSGVRQPGGGAPIIITPVPPEKVSTGWRYKFLPAFWTVASTISIVVNVILIAIVFILLQMLGQIRSAADNRVSNLLGELYGNFAAMDSATISRVIPVDANIPLNLSVPVTLNNQRIVLAQDTPLVAHVVIDQPGLHLDSPRTTITLSQGQQLIVNLDQFNLPVQNTVPVHLDVPVNIPLKETALHQPFVGLRDIVQPYYCMVQPKAALINGQSCP
jgi:hypothetical protein